MSAEGKAQIRVVIDSSLLSLNSTGIQQLEGFLPLLNITSAIDLNKKELCNGQYFFLLRCFIDISGCTTVEALEGATLHPAQVLGIEHKKGTLNYESDADLVFLDDDLNVHATLIAGEPVWLKKGGLVTFMMQLNYNMIPTKSKKHMR